MKKLARIFWTFLKIGPSTFGGGYAMIPIIQREVERNGWMTPDELADILSVSGSAPGGIGVNVSAYVGYRLAGIPGALAAVLGITLPTFLIILALSLTSSFFAGNAKVEAALQGIHGGIVALIIVAAVKMGKSAIIDKTTLLMTAATVGVLLLTAINPLYLIVAGLFIGFPIIILKQRMGYRAQAKKDVVPKEDGHYQYADYFIAEGI